MKVLNKDYDTEEMCASTTSKQDSKSPSPFECEDTRIEILMIEKRDTNLIFSKQQLEMSGLSKSISKPQKRAPLI